MCSTIELKAQNIIRTETVLGGLNRGENVATDALGNVYVVERFGARVRRYDITTKTVSTIVTGLLGARGIAFDENGNFFISESNGGGSPANRITRYTYTTTATLPLTGTVVAGNAAAGGYTGDNGAATAATLNGPWGMAYDKAAKLLYIAEVGNNIIRKIDFSVTTPLISTFAGIQGTNASFLGANAITTTFRSPTSVALDANGDVYWSGSLMYEILKSTKNGGTVSRIIGNGANDLNTGDGGLATAARLGQVGVGGLAFDPTGNLYVSVGNFHRVRRILTTGVTGVFGNVENYAGFDNFISGTTTVATGGEGGPASITTASTTTIMNNCQGIAFNPAGTILWIVENTGGVLRAVGTAAVLTTTLPLDLTSFEVKSSNETAVLQWVTENEVNFKGFVVERKGDNDLDFTSINTVATKNLKTVTTYNFTDFSPLKGNNYYRLKMVDNDGTFKYSDVKVVKFASLSQKQISIYPNPVQNTLNLNHAEAEQGASISIYSMESKLVMKKELTRNSTQSSIDATSLISGQYILEFDNNGNKQKLKFVK
ncbi:hypothetical protein A5893_13125 [Pedobacter psychrophilus]|uniref:Secretion system C-terminal sorting domain-containing protein n=2 Tax=Pedobacter psychrophilus TaxID=1826909 RepID=A0A179DDJ6_9SPHI|nr:hypothetical protein A5893_13125 [Pedobacter psychrophilus]